MNITRKLASIQIVDSIKDIPGKDKIGLAKINGWNAIVNKEEIKVGDQVVFFEQDSLLPEVKVFEFMRKNNFRVQKMKIGKVVSEGLVMPIKTVFSDPEFLKTISDPDAFIAFNPPYITGEDFTEILGVKHFEDRIHESRKFNANSDCLTTFPNSVPKTDAIRIQNFQELLNMDSKYFTERYAITEKLNGTSMTVIVGTPKEIGLRIDSDEVQVIVCSREFVRKESTDCDYWRMVKDSKLDESLKRYYRDLRIPIAIQGEIIGPGIQKNIYKLKERKFMVFAIYDIRHEQYADLWGTNKGGPENLTVINEYFSDLYFVPFIGHMQLPGFYFNGCPITGPNKEERENETVEDIERQKMEDCAKFFNEIKNHVNEDKVRSALNKMIIPEGIVLSSLKGYSIKYII